MSKKLILASSSQSRLDLLQKIYIIPDKIMSPDINETPLKKERPAHIAKRLAFEKAKKIYEILKTENIQEDILILGGDTVAAIGNKIMEKTYDKKVLKTFLENGSGKNHKVHSGFCIFDLKSGKFVSKVVTSKVKIKRLSKEELEFYLETGEGYGKAGGYTVSGFAECFVEKIIGSFSNIVGLPLTEVNNTLRSFGYHKHMKTHKK